MALKDLPDDIKHAVFCKLSPRELALAAPSCKELAAFSKHARDKMYPLLKEYPALYNIVEAMFREKSRPKYIRGLGASVSRVIKSSDKHLRKIAETKLSSHGNESIENLYEKLSHDIHLSIWVGDTVVKLNADSNIFKFTHYVLDPDIQPKCAAELDSPYAAIEHIDEALKSAKIGTIRKFKFTLNERFSAVGAKMPRKIDASLRTFEQELTYVYSVTPIETHASFRQASDMARAIARRLERHAVPNGNILSSKDDSWNRVDGACVETFSKYI